MSDRTIKYISIFFITIGLILCLTSAVWTAKLCFCFLKLKIGLLWTIGALFFLPVLIILMPWYLFFAEGQSFPLLISYGACLAAYILLTGGRYLYNSSSEDKI